MNAIQRLCKRAILVDQGEIQLTGDAATVVEKYQYDTTQVATLSSWMDVTNVQRTGDGSARFVAVRLFGNEEGMGEIVTGGRLHVELMIQSKVERAVSSIAVTVFDSNGTKLINADSVSQGVPVLLGEGLSRYRFAIDALHLTAGTYVLGLWLANYPGNVYDRVPVALLFDVMGNGTANIFGVQADGVVPCSFHLSPLEPAGEFEPI